MEIDGAGGDFPGLEISGGESEVRGLVMNSFSGENGGCLLINKKGANIIAGNRFGTDITGTTSVPTVAGIRLNSDGNQIGGEAAEDVNIIDSLVALSSIARRTKSLAIG